MKPSKKSPFKSNPSVYSYPGITSETYSQNGFYHTVQNPEAQISVSVINTANLSLDIMVQASFDGENWFILSTYQQPSPNNSFFAGFFFTPSSSIRYYRLKPGAAEDVYLLQVDEQGA